MTAEVPLMTMTELHVAADVARSRVDEVRVGQWHRPPRHVEAWLHTTDPQGLVAALRQRWPTQSEHSAAADLRARLHLLPGWVKT